MHEFTNHVHINLLMLFYEINAFLYFSDARFTNSRFSAYEETQRKFQTCCGKVETSDTIDVRAFIM